MLGYLRPLQEHIKRCCTQKNRYHVFRKKNINGRVGKTFFSEKYENCISENFQYRTMLIPVRCFSCGKVVGNLWEKYQQMLTEDYNESDALNHLNLTRYCCRRMILSHIDSIDHFTAYDTKIVGNMPVK